MYRHRSFAAFLGLLAVGVTAFGGLVLPRLAAGEPGTADERAARVVVVHERNHVPTRWQCPEHERRSGSSPSI